MKLLDGSHRKTKGAPLTFLHTYERVYYLDYSTFPSTKEKSGYWVGVSKNIGNALTYKILTDDKETVISCSIVRTAEE
jgi:hypothetical protein